MTFRGRASRLRDETGAVLGEDPTDHVDATGVCIARAAGVPVFFSLGGGGKPSDIAEDLAPTGDEPVVSSGVDKFAGADLDQVKF